jgi:FtsZ-binding cell division protein ZapB
MLASEFSVRETSPLNYYSLLHLFDDQPLLRLFRRQDPGLVIAVLYTLFKQRERLTISYEDAVLELGLFLDDIAQPDAEMIDSVVRAEKLIQDWCSPVNRFLRRYLDQSGLPVLELTPHTERAIRLIEDLTRVNYVATESRFTDILYRLRRLSRESIVDPEEKIAELEKQQAEIQAEIDTIRENNEVASLDTRQMEEQLFELSRSAKDLIADFSSVEENFRNILGKIYQEEVEHGSSRGRILKAALNAADELHNTPQGKSFDAFWNFLVTDYGRDEINTMVEKVFTDLAHRGMNLPDTFLLRLKPLLLNAGKRIIDSNRRLSERLNRIIVGPDAQRSRMLLEQIKEIKALVLGMKQELPDELAFMSVETYPDIYLPIERPLSLQKEDTDFSFPRESELQAPDFSLLTDLFFIDYQVLQQHVTDLLNTQQVVSLKQVVTRYPPTKGLAEIIAYLDIGSQDPYCAIQEEEFSFSYSFEGTTKRITVPQLLFSREVITDG